jgi:hypothetical protein
VKPCLKKPKEVGRRKRGKEERKNKNLLGDLTEKTIWGGPRRSISFEIGKQEVSRRVQSMSTHLARDQKTSLE